MKFETQKYRIKVSLLKEKGGDKACFSLEKIERLKNGHLKYDGKDKETKYFGNKIVINKEDQLEIYDGDKQTEHRNKIPGTNVQIVQTPGHCPEHCSLIVPTATETYVVAGDVFWWQAGRKQDTNIEKEDEAHPEEVNMEKLIKSRRYLLQAGDYIIPGHGKTFRVP